MTVRLRENNRQITRLDEINAFLAKINQLEKKIEKLDDRLRCITEHPARLRSPLMGIRETAEYLGMSISTVKKYTKDLGGVKRFGSWRFKKEIIDLRMGFKNE